MGRAPRFTSLLVLALLAAAVSVPAALGAVVNVSMRDDFFQPQTARAALGDTVTWTNSGFNPHTATSTNRSVKNPNGTPGLGLWDSGTLTTGGQFSRPFRHSSRFPYYCKVHPVVMKGTISVPLNATTAPATGGTRITVQWGTVNAPTGFVFDVRRKLPGSSTFQPWQVGVTVRQASFVATNPGTYSFSSRMRRPSTGGVSLFSETKSVTI
jgi:plastocyanin